jgi:hypothetical protein
MKLQRRRFLHLVFGAAALPEIELVVEGRVDGIGRRHDQKGMEAFGSERTDLPYFSMGW